MSVTLSQLRTRARHLADQDTSTFPTDTQYNDYIRYAAGDLWTKLIMAGHTPARVDVTIVATGATNYAIGTDVQTVLSVEYLCGGQDLMPLFPAQLEDIPGLRSLPTNRAQNYVLVDGFQSTLKIEFFPKPTTGTYFVRYIPIFTGLAADGDIFYGPQRMEEYIVTSAAIQGLNKEGGDTSALEKQRNAAWEDLLVSLAARDVNIERVRDLSQYRRDPFDFPIKGVDDI